MAITRHRQIQQGLLFGCQSGASLGSQSLLHRVNQIGPFPFFYGLLLNLSFWPFTLGGQTDLSFVPGASVAENLHRYLVFDATTSLGWDTGRAITNALLIAVAGGAVLGALRRAARKASFDTPATFLAE